MRISNIEHRILNGEVEIATSAFGLLAMTGRRGVVRFLRSFAGIMSHPQAALEAATRLAVRNAG